MSIIQARNVRKTYSGDGSDVHALDGVDLDVADGEFIAVMGPSGSGKSTLLHVLGALDVPDSGDIVLDGKDLAKLSRAELADVRRQSVGFVFQFFNLVPVLTIGENVALPAVLDGVGEKDAADRAQAVLASLGLESQEDKLPAQLSGGEQQRVAVARAVINSPALLLADEPTGNLDRASGADVLRLFGTLNDDGQTVVIVTHDPAVASHAARVVFMRDGRLVDETPIVDRGDPAVVLARLASLEG